MHFCSSKFIHRWMKLQLSNLVYKKTLPFQLHQKTYLPGGFCKSHHNSKRVTYFLPADHLIKSLFHIFWKMRMCVDPGGQWAPQVSSRNLSNKSHYTFLMQMKKPVDDHSVHIHIYAAQVYFFHYIIFDVTWLLQKIIINFGYKHGHKTGLLLVERAETLQYLGSFWTPIFPLWSDYWLALLGTGAFKLGCSLVTLAYMYHNVTNL